jgi:gliding motility-associated-like protein
VHDSTLIANSKYKVADGQIFNTRSIQLGPNGKIYQNFFDHLNAIHNPNEIGATCDFELNAIDLNGVDSRSGLPNFIASSIIPVLKDTQMLCQFDSLHFSFLDSCVLSVKWIYNHSTTSDTLVGQTVDYQFVDSGYYFVTAIFQFGQKTESYHGVVYATPTPNTQYTMDSAYLCKDDSVFLLAGPPSSTYQWSTGSVNESIMVGDTGWYVITVSNSCSTFVDSIKVQIMPKLMVNLGIDTTVCPGDQFNISPKIDGIETGFKWWDGDSTSLFRSNINTSGTSLETLWISYENQCEVVADTLHISYQLPPKMDWFNDSLLCHRLSPTITLPTSDSITYFLTYAGESGKDTLNYPWLIQQSGFYTLAAITACDTVSKSSYLSPTQIITTALAVDTSYCLGHREVLNAFSKGSTYLWSSGSTDSAIVVDQSGLYEVTVTNVPCKRAFQTNVIFSPDACLENPCPFTIPNVFTPNADQVNDVLEISNDCSSFAFDAFIYNRWGQLVWSQHKNAQLNALRWDGYSNGSLNNEGVYFIVIEFVDTQGNHKTLRTTVSLLH